MEVLTLICNHSKRLNEQLCNAEPKLKIFDTAQTALMLAVELQVESQGNELCRRMAGRTKMLTPVVILE